MSSFTSPRTISLLQQCKDDKNLAVLTSCGTIENILGRIMDNLPLAEGGDVYIANQVDQLARQTDKLRELFAPRVTHHKVVGGVKS